MSRRPVWEKIRAAVSDFVSSGGVFGVSLFKGPLEPASVSGLVPRIAPVPGGYAVLQATEPIGGSSEVSPDDGPGTPVLNPAGKALPPKAKAKAKAKSPGAPAGKSDKVPPGQASKAADAALAAAPAVAAEPAPGAAPAVAVESAPGAAPEKAVGAAPEKAVGVAPEKAADGKTAVAADEKKTEAAGAVVDAGVALQEGTFTVNGVSIDVAPDDTVGAVLDKITGSGAGVSAAVDPETQTVTLTSTRLTSEAITIGYDTSGFLAAVKLDETAVSAAPAESSPFDVAVGDMIEFAPVQAGSVSVAGHEVSVDPDVTTVRSLVTALNGVDGVSASLDEPTGRITIASQSSQPLTLEDTSGMLGVLGIAEGTHQGTSTFVAVTTVAVPAPESHVAVPTVAVPAPEPNVPVQTVVAPAPEPNVTVQTVAAPALELNVTAQTVAAPPPESSVAVQTVAAPAPATELPAPATNTAELAARVDAAVDRLNSALSRFGSGPASTASDLGQAAGKTVEDTLDVMARAGVDGLSTVGKGGATRVVVERDKLAASLDTLDKAGGPGRRLDRVVDRVTDRVSALASVKPSDAARAAKVSHVNTWRVRGGGRWRRVPADHAAAVGASRTPAPAAPAVATPPTAAAPPTAATPDSAVFGSILDVAKGRK